MYESFRNRAKRQRNLLRFADVTGLVLAAIVGLRWGAWTPGIRTVNLCAVRESYTFVSECDCGYGKMSCMAGRTYYVYILSSETRRLYVGVTNDLTRRVSEHRVGKGGDFTRKYKIHRLAYYETFGEINDAIAREKEIKAWRRDKKVALIEAENPHWDDLFMA